MRIGKTWWTTRLGTTVQGFPVSFMVDGKQYIAVTTALGGGSPQLTPGTMLTEGHRRPTCYALCGFGQPDGQRVKTRKGWASACLLSPIPRPRPLTGAETRA